jgi:hypothetical protein
MTRKKHLCCATACAVMLVLQAGCASVSRGSFCGLYRPVYTSAADTEETRRQADANNAVWMRLCANEVPDPQAP